MKKTSGKIGYFNLDDWWNSSFSPNERKYIEDLYASNFGEGVALTTGTMLDTTGSASQFLWGLSTWFRKKEDLSLAVRILLEAEKLADNVIDRHYVFQCAIQTYYRMRDLDDKYMALAQEYCLKQIQISGQAADELKSIYPNSVLPSHVGFKQLSIILEKRGSYEEAIGYLKKALVEGWSGDWEKRISRCNKRLKKQS